MCFTQQPSRSCIPTPQVHLRSFLSYPLEETASSEAAKPFVEDNIREVVDAVVAAADSGELAAAVKGGHDTFKVGDGLEDD